MAKTSFLCAVKNLVDKELSLELSDIVIECFDKCSELYFGCERRFIRNLSANLPDDEFISDCEIDVKPSDSVSQVTSKCTVNTAKSSVVRRIELERKRAEIQSAAELAKARKAKQQAELEARRVQAAAEAEARRAQAEARRAHLLAEAEEAEALAKLSLQTANLEAEEKLLARSERGSVATMSRASRTKSSVRPCVPAVNSTNLRREQNPVPVSQSLLKQTESSTAKPYRVADRFSRLDLNNPSSSRVNGCNYDQDLDYYHGGSTRDEVAIPDVGVSRGGNTKCNPPTRLEPQPHRHEFYAPNPDVNLGTYST